MIEPTTDTQQEKAQTAVRTRQGSFAVDVLKLVSGSTIAQVISVLASPVLSRLFGPDAFGVFALFSSIVGILAAVFTLEYELAIMLPKEDSDAASIVTGSLGIATLFSLLTAVAIWLGGPVIARWLNAPELTPFLWLVPILLFFGGIGAGHPVLNAWASRKRQFAKISTTQVASTLTSTLAKLGAGFMGFISGSGLIAGTMLGSILSPILLGSSIWRQDRSLFLEKVRWQAITDNLKRYRKFAIYNTPSTLLNTISWQVPSFLLAFFFSPTVVGYYAFGNQLLRVPMNLVGGSISQAFYSHAAAAHRDGHLATFVEETFQRLVNYSFFPILMLAVIGKDLFTIIFGAEWTEAGVYTQILSLWMIFWFVSAPMARLFNVLEKNEFSFRINVVILITRVLSIWLGSVWGGPRLALIFFSFSGALVYGFLSVSIMMIAGVSWNRIASILLQNVAIFVVPGTIVLLLVLFQVSGWIVLILASLSIGTYYLYRFKNEPAFRQVLAKVRSVLGMASS